MKREDIIYYSENAEIDIWEKLLRYTYKKNIKSYFEDNLFEYNELIGEAISGSISQAYEYFHASKVCTINTSPLMLYYGSINLLFGISCLKTGKLLRVNSHGLSLVHSKTHSILEGKVSIINRSNAGFKEYHEGLFRNSLDNVDKSMSILNMILCIPEVAVDFIKNLPIQNVLMIPLNKIVLDDTSYYKVNKDMVSLTPEEEKEIVGRVINLEANYFISFNNANEGLFTKKLNGKNMVKKSYYNEHYFSVDAELAKWEDIDEYLIGFIALFALSDICRYKPEIWNPFVKDDMTGELGIVENFIRKMRRFFPNKVLDILEGGKHIFTNKLGQDIDKRKMISEENIKQIKQDIIKELGGTKR